VAVDCQEAQKWTLRSLNDSLPQKCPKGPPSEFQDETFGAIKFSGVIFFPEVYTGSG